MITTATRTSAQEPARAKVEWREVALFSLLAYGLSWLWWAPTVAPLLGPALSTGTTTTLPTAPLLIGMFGPLAATLVMRLLVSKEGIKGSLGIWRSWRYYLVAVAGPGLFVATLILFNHLAGFGPFVRSLNWGVPLSIAISGIVASPFGLGEEYGWRGYLLPRLLPLGEIRGTMILGSIWAFWHLPIVVVGLNYPGQNPLLSVLVFTFTVICLSFPFTWLFRASMGSAYLAGLMHAVINTFDSFTDAKAIPNGNPLLAHSLGLISGIGILALIIIVYGVFKRSPRVDAERLQPQLDGTWRDWLR